MTDDTLLEVKGLKTHFFTNDGVVRAVDGVTLAVPRGKTVCVVGESGCGKSVTARSILRLVDEPGRIVEGEIRWRYQPPVESFGARDRTGASDPGRTDIVDAKPSGTTVATIDRPPTDAEAIDLTQLNPHGDAMRRIRGGEISMIFQEPMASLSPMWTIGDQMVETIRLHLPMNKQEAREHAISLLRRVGIPRPEERIDAYSFQLSGGMCQRVMIAIALSCGPGLLIADEPTTALDVTTQARILDLIRDLQDETRMGVLFITHDLGVVAELADEVVVMYLGTVVERGTVDEIFHDPKHPYTRALLESIPKMGAGTRQRLRTVRGMVPPPSRRPAGCPFHPRCDHAIPGRCDTEDPPVIEFRPGRLARCVLYQSDETGISTDSAESHQPEPDGSGDDGAGSESGKESAA